MASEDKKSDSGIIGLSLLLLVILVVLGSFINRNNTPYLDDKPLSLQKQPSVEQYAMRSSEEKRIWKAVYDNNLSVLSVLLNNSPHYFEQDDEKINYSKLGTAFLNRVVSFQTVKSMYQYGLKLNDLKPVTISWEAKQFFKENDINVTNLDPVYLPQDVQNQMAEYDLDLNYYCNKNIDEYYLAELAENLPSTCVTQTLLWLLDHGYEPEPTALGYMFAKLLERKDIVLNASTVEEFARRGLRFSMYEKGIYTRKEYNAYAAISALFFSGRMDDNSLVSALREQGMLINSSNYFGRSVVSNICSADEDIIEAHEQGIINLLNQGLVVGGKSLEGCPKDRLALLKELGNGKSSQSLEHHLSVKESSTLHKIERGLSTPMGAAFLLYLGVPVLLFILLITILILFVRSANKK